jgi:hypothetical protein
MNPVSGGPLKRILREAGVPHLVDVLARLTPTDLQSVMLEVYRHQAARISPAELLGRYADNRFARPAAVEPRAIAAFEELAWSLLPSRYRVLELSPLCPLGTHSVVATVDQNKVISTIRNTEVVADSTNVLALECALRRRSLLQDPDARSKPVCLATSQRQVRAQSFGDPREWAHFGLLALVASGRDRGFFSFEIEALRQQIGYFIALLNQFRPEWRLDVALTDLAHRSMALQEGVLGQLSQVFPEVTFRMDAGRSSGRSYYVDVCYKLFVRDPSGTLMDVGDGGCTTWTRRLLSDERERLVISGLGAERILA